MPNWLALAVVGGLIVAGGGYAVYQTWFAPEGSTLVDEPLPDLGPSPSSPMDGQGSTPAPDAPQPLRTGAFQGADSFHFARGTVALYQAANGTYLLRFEDYDAREGPDVYLYLTRNAGDRTTNAVEGEGLRLQVPGGEGNGRATVRGSFNVYLPVGTDALAYGGLTIWCDDFDHFFGHAALA